MKNKFLILLPLMLLLSACTIGGNYNDAGQKIMERTAEKTLGSIGSQECTYEIDGETIISYIKQGKIRTDMGDQQVISDGEYVWTWSEIKKSGQKLKMEENKMDDLRMPSKEELENVEEMAKQMQEEYKGTCKKTPVSDSMFLPPTYVNWMDYEAQEQKMDQLTEQYMNSDEAKQNQVEMDQMLKEALKEAGAE